MMQTTEMKRKIFFVTFLRALAVCLITNAHYAGVYPTDFLANGGMLGDVIFFGVSGFCLYNIKTGFFPWYGKRLYRCYLPTLIITGVYLLLGLYSFSEHGAVWWFIYPTCYHFIASIVILYIPYYIVMRVRPLRERLPLVMAVVAAAALIVYIVFYDRSLYHIDNVREPFIEFLFFESMLMGAYFAQNKEKLLNRRKVIFYILPVVLFGAYFACKMLFSRYGSLLDFQILNQFALTAFLYSIFRCFIGLDSALERLPSPIKKAISYIAEITLEIYVVQYVLISLLAQRLAFPLNWFAVTAAILAAATALHFVCKGITIGFNALRARVTKRG